MAHPSDSGTTGALKRPKQGSALKKAYSAAEMRALLAELKLRLIAGDDDEDIRALLDVSVGRYNELKKELYRQEQAGLSLKTTEDVYLEYKWAQTKCIADLDAAIVEIPENQPNAKVGAIKARSDIIDKILRTGQDMGIISKEPERKLVIHGHVVAQMSNSELRAAIAKETNQLAGAIARHGDVDMDGNPIGEGSNPTFSSQEKSGMNISGPSKAAAARASRVSVKRQKVIDV